MDPIGQIPPIVSLDDLIQTKEAIAASEERDKALLRTLVNVNESQLRGLLFTWASTNFTDNYILYEFQLDSRCLDGVIRNCIDYITYLGFDPVTALESIQQRLPGMSLSYSYTNDFKFRVHVTKTT